MTILRAQSSISKVLDDVFADFLTNVENVTPQAVKIFGPKEDAANLAPPGLWWTPGEETWGAGGPRAHGVPSEPGSLWTRQIPISFLIFGGENSAEDYAAERAAAEQPAEEPTTSLHDTDVTEYLLEQLVNSFHRRLSHATYQITGCSWGADAQTGIAIACDLSVLLRLPLVRIDNGVVTLEAVHPTVKLPSDP